MPTNLPPVTRNLLIANILVFALQYLLQDGKLTIGGNNPRQSLMGALGDILDRKATL